MVSFPLQIRVRVPNYTQQQLGNPTEAQNVPSWKEPKRTTESNSCLHTTAQNSNPMSESAVQTFIQLTEAQCCDHWPGEPFPCPLPSGEESQPDPPLT